MIRILTRLFVVCCASAALAQTPPPAPAPHAAVFGDSAKAVIGTWEFSNADRDKTCTLTLKSSHSPVGFKAEFDKNCVNLFPLVTDVAGWTFPDNDLLRLIDAQGKSLAEFSEVEDGIFEAPTPGVGVLFLQRPGAAGAMPKQPSDMAGDWTMRRGNSLLCALMLSTVPLRDALTLTVKPGCAVSIAQLGFAQWQLERGELVLVPARGNPWRFEEVDNISWRRLPESTDPIMLVRQ